MFHIMCVINVSLHWYVGNCWHNCKFNALQWNALGGIFITSLVLKNSSNYLWVTILNLIEKITKKTFIQQEENLIFVRLLHTKPMIRPCSIARGNCEPKTIKCQIYDTDQFTMIWRKTDLPFFIHFFLRIFFLLSLSRIWGWVCDTKKDTRSSLLYEASQSNVDNAAKCNGKWKSKWAARDAEDNSSSRRRRREEEKSRQALPRGGWFPVASRWEATAELY